MVFSMDLQGEVLLSLVLILVPSGTCGAVHRVKREEHCPIYRDPAWMVQDTLCQPDDGIGKAYHCFESDNGHVVDDGCFEPKSCRSGSHPIVEGTVIICEPCSDGFQPVDGLNSAEYTHSHCRPHAAKCNPEYGQSQCRAPTRESDRACTCNATLGFSPRINSSECQCFTPNSPCSGCDFTGCPPGSVRNDKGYCAPKMNASTTLGPVTPTEQTGGGEQDEMPAWAIVLIVIIIIVLAGLGLLSVWCWSYHKAMKNSVDQRGPPLVQAEETNCTSQRNGDSVLYFAGITNVENLYVSGHGTTTVNVKKAKGRTVFGGENIINHEGENRSTGSTEEPTDSSLGATMSNGKLPSDTAEEAQAPESQEPADPVSPEDKVPAEKLSEGVPGAAESEEAPPLLPTAPNPPLDPSAPPPSLSPDQGSVEEEDLDETLLKTPLSQATSEETRVKVPASDLSDESEVKPPAPLDDEQIELKRRAAAEDSGDTEQLENPDAKTPLLGNDSHGKGDASSRGKNGWLRDEDSKSKANVIQALASADEEADVSIHNTRKVFPIPSA